ncbi:MAG: VPDSG-CTERM sorting domain-containing protein [Chthoniobacterales bacterium]
MRISKRVLASILTVVVSVSATKPVFGSPGNTITLIENSPTDLSVVYTGALLISSDFMVTNTGPDLWTIKLRQPSANELIYGVDYSFSDFSNGWIEPENLLQVNEVTHSSTTNSDEFFVHSDLSVLLNTTATADNTPIVVGGFNLFGFDPIFLTFHDVAASTEASQGVPDSGTTVGLLVLALAALFGLRRLVSVPVA